MEELLIIEKIYREGCDLKPKDRYFEGAEEIPGILKCLTNAIHEMRMEGLGYKKIDPKAFISPPLRSIATTQSQWARHDELQEQMLGDMQRP